MTSSLKLTTAVFFLTVALKIGSIDSSPPDYIEILVPSTRTLYKYHEDVATWSDARDTCISDGGLLFYPEDQNELDTVIARLGFSNHYLHIGFRMHSNIKINHSISIPQYQTVDGRNLSEVYRKWYRGKPVFGLNKGAECGVLVVPPLDIVLGSCDLLKSYICKIALNTTEEDVGTPIEKVCLSRSCIITASEMIRALDETKDPCNDFYDFACGGWIRNNPIAEGKSGWGIWEKIEEQNQIVIRYALEKVNLTEPSSAEAKARMYYDACIDAKGTIEEQEKKPLLKVIRDLGGWHLLESMTSSQLTPKRSFQQLLEDVHNKYYLGGLFNWRVGEDDRNSSRNVIMLNEVSLILEVRDYYLNKTANKKVLDAYLDYMTSICVLLGATETEAKAEMAKVINFETDLANITTLSEDRTNVEGLYNLYTIREWQTIAPFMNWSSFFNNTFRSVNRSISEDEQIVVYAPDYFRNLTKVLEKYSKTEEGQKTVTSYMMWQVSNYFSEYLSKSFRDARKFLLKAMYGTEGTERTWKNCVEDTDSVMGFAVGAMFVREVFHGKSKAQAEIMIDNIRNAIKRNLKNLTWLDDETRNNAEIKADAIKNIIGFPDYILDKTELDKKYEDMEVKPNEFFENKINHRKFVIKNVLKKLDQAVNKTEWVVAPTAVNAYYSFNMNLMVFPAGVLQLPLYDSDNPKSVNYGAMGFVMGHELIHAFDNQGRRFDRFGNLNQWWNNASISEFENRADCIQKQYSTYSHEGQYLKAKQNLDENIADIGGLKASFNAYLDYSKHADVNYTLPGLKYNHRQLFFISFAQVMCSVLTKESIKMQIETNSHTTNRYRVIGSIVNLKEFSEEFQCPLGSQMNPKDKCELW